jgi:hypothetical protein
MRFKPARRFYCAVDLQARTMYLSILEHSGGVVFNKSLPATSLVFLDASALAPDWLGQFRGHRP